MSIFFVAEVGINHNGDMSICKDLIDIAVDSGCNAVKFQKRDLNKVYTQEFLDKIQQHFKLDTPPTDDHIRIFVRESFKNAVEKAEL